MNNKNNGLSINLAVVGSKGTGKSAITVRFLTRKFIGEYPLQSDFCVNRDVNIAGRMTDIHVKDTYACDWLKGPSALIGWSTALAIVYSVTDPKSFELAAYILGQLNVTKRLESTNILLLGNKNDLDHLRRVSPKEGKELALQYGTHFQETSASNDLNGVIMAFERLLFSALNSQESKLQYNNYTEQVFPVSQRKCNRVVRDYRRDSRAKQLRRMSTGSHGSSADTVSTISDDDRLFSYIDSSQSSNLSTPEHSPQTSPIPSAGKRKISLPVLLEKMGFSNHNHHLPHHHQSTRKSSLIHKNR